MTRWGDLLERKKPIPTPRFYVARAIGDAGFLGIGTAITPTGGSIPLVSDGSTLSWGYAEEPVLAEGATVELLGPFDEEEAESVAREIAGERSLAATQKMLDAATEARRKARLIIGPSHLVFEERYEERIEALAEVIFQARGYPGQELPR